MAEINYRIILKIIGSLLCIEAMFMIFPLITAFIYQEPSWIHFLAAMLATLLAGSALFYTCRNCDDQMGKREGVLLVSVTWVIFSAFGMIPFYYTPQINTITDSFFETVSGFTTTGASVLDDISLLPKSILLWRSMLQWLGGMGIILFTLAVLPMLNYQGGMQLFNAEVTGVTRDKLRPRISQTAKRLWFLYFSMTVVLCLLLLLGPMNLFEAICHSLSTISTGGFSTEQAGISYWESAYTEYIIILFMFLGGINFSLLYNFFAGNVKKLWHSEEVRWYISIVAIATIAMGIGLYHIGVTLDFESTLRLALFQTVTIITSTGYGTGDYVMWGPFFCTIVMVLSFFGACAGSTSGGAKIDRMLVLFKNTKNEFFRVIHPNAIVPVRVNGKSVPYEIVSKILAFLIVYALVIVGGALALSAMGIPVDEAFGSTLSCISNVGPGLGATGPMGNYAHIPDLGKWILSFIMLVGRLELFTVLILFTPYFWKRN